MNIVAISTTAKSSVLLRSHRPMASHFVNVMESSLPLHSRRRISAIRNPVLTTIRQWQRAWNAGMYGAVGLQRVDTLECALRPLLAILVEILLLGVGSKRIHVGRIDLLALGLEEFDDILLLRVELDRVI